MHALPRDELVAALRRLGGTPPHVLENDRLLDLLLPTIRADFKLALEYEVVPGPTLACPLTAFAGTRDPDVPVEDVAAWRQHTTGPFVVSRLEAGHHVVKECGAEIVGEIVRALIEGGT
jgi:medium-chain acyl-[acyl-carrier-protein] hydrolase